MEGLIKDESQDRSIERIDAAILDINRNIDRNSQRENTFVRTIGWVSSVVLAVFFGFQLLSYISIRDEASKIRADTASLIENTEREIERILGTAIPESAFAHPPLGEETRKIISNVVLFSQKFRGSDIWEASFNYSIVIKSIGQAPGKLIGYEYRFSEELIEMIEQLGLTDDSRFLRQDLDRPRYSTLAESEIVSRDLGRIKSNGYTIRNTDCEVVWKFIEALTKNDHGITLKVRPVLERAQRRSVDSEFELEFVYTSVISGCPNEPN